MNAICLILIYVAIMNIIGFVIMGVDKKRAEKHEWRIPEKTLFAVCILGGSLGATLGMFFFHHKTKHWYFRYGFPAILVIHIILAIFLVGSNNITIM